MGKKQTAKGRAGSTPSPEWVELRKRFIHPGQLPYEEIRTVLNFDQDIAERAAEVGVSPKTLARKVQHFIQYGLPGLMPGNSHRPDDRRHLPADLRDYILQLKAEHPPFTLREIADILEVKFDRRVSHHTVEQTIARSPLPKVIGRRYPRYFKMRDPAERREAMLRLHLDGWSMKAIMGYLGAPRRSVQAFLTRWVADGVQSLPGKKSGRPRGIRKVTLPIVAAIKEKQETTAIGKFRMAAYLKQQFGIELSPATCGRVMAKNQDLYELPERPQDPPPPKKEMPFKATYAHQFWSVDICYIEHHQLPDQEGSFYIITVLDNYSRKIVASAPSRTQDLWAFLLVFCTALYVYGAPAGLVSDGAVCSRLTLPPSYINF